jgi:hypothetical protein
MRSVAAGLLVSLLAGRSDNATIGYERSVEALNGARGRFLPSLTLESPLKRWAAGTKPAARHARLVSEVRAVDRGQPAETVTRRGGCVAIRLREPAPSASHPAAIPGNSLAIRS